MTGRHLTVAQAAEEYFVPEKTIRRWLERGLLDWQTPGLIADSDVARVEQSTRRLARMGRIVALSWDFGASCAAGPPISESRQTVTIVPE